VRDETIVHEICANIEKYKSPWFKPKAKEVKLKITDNALRYLTRHIPANLIILEQSRDFVIAELVYFVDTEALAFVKKWLPDIVILDNDEMREILKSDLKNYLKKF